MKFSDIQARADKKNPNMTLEVELNGAEVELTLRNVLRLTEEDAKTVREAFDIMSANEEEVEGLLKDDEKEATAYSVLANRISTALRATTSSKKIWDEFVEALKADGDFNMLMLEVWNAYNEETRLGEASPSAES